MDCNDLKINLAYVIIAHNTYYGITTEFVLVAWEVELNGMLCICEDFILFEAIADYRVCHKDVCIRYKNILK